MEKRIRISFLAAAFFIIIFGTLVSEAGTLVPCTTTYIESSPVHSVHYWTLSITGGTVTAEIYNEDSADGQSAMLWISGDEAHKIRGELLSKRCILSFNISDLPDGTYTLNWHGPSPKRSGRRTLGIFMLRITGEKAEFYLPGGKSEKAFYDSLSRFNPNDYNDIPASAGDMEHLNDVITLARDLVRNCTTDAEKIRAIHDWMATNISYDYEHLLNNTDIDIDIGDYIFENRHAVCSGYSWFARLMFGAVGIPCLQIRGYASSGSAITEKSSIDFNHDWNVVYINGKWIPIDITWDSHNSYYGKSSSENVLLTPPVYTYYLVSPEVLSRNHCSLMVSGDEDETGEITGKKTNTLRIKKIKYRFKRAKLKKRKVFAIQTRNAKGKVTYSLSKAAKRAKIRVSKKGKVTIPPKCKKGTYKITVKASGNKKYTAKKMIVKIVIT